jgi:hypothetical protein
MLSRVETSFRTELHQQFYQPTPWEAALNPLEMTGNG